ncbi:MAG: HAD-IA family hydrolase [Nitrososphaerota archaeon]
MTLQKIENGIFVQDAIFDKIKKIDAIIFDCDGVLIDITKSYDLAIKEVTKYFLKQFGIEKSLPITSDIIEGFKSTGGFNDEVDVTYALILSLVAANRMQTPEQKFLFDVINKADQTGVQSVEKYIATLSVDISDIRKNLNYPGPHDTNLLYSVFDQMFYGSELYYKIFKKQSQFSGQGFIKNDMNLLRNDLVKKLKTKFKNKLAIVTGRGRESIRYTLGNLLDEFDLRNSVFLEDEPRDLAKPNPQSLIKSIHGLDSACCLYVGDSMEDYIMAKKATEKGYDTIFCAIFGTSKSYEAKRIFFEQKNAPMILQSIDLLPKALNLV